MKHILILLLVALTNCPMYAQSNAAEKPVHVAILLYPGVELLDFAGPLEVFAAMKNSRVFTVAAKPGPLHSMRKSLVMTPDFTLDNCPAVDVLVVPGATPDVIREVTADSSTINWIRRVHAQSQLTMSVCTGIYLLGQANVLTNKTITTHWASVSYLRKAYTHSNVVENARFVDDGNLLTTAGVSAGIDGALRVVARLQGEEAARTIARYIEYDAYRPNAGLVVGK